MHTSHAFAWFYGGPPASPTGSQRGRGRGKPPLRGGGLWALFGVFLHSSILFLDPISFLGSYFFLGFVFGYVFKCAFRCFWIGVCFLCLATPRGIGNDGIGCSSISQVTPPKNWHGCSGGRPHVIMPAS